MSLCKLNSQLNLVNKVVVVDGMIGGGKNLLSSIVSSLPNVEMWIHRTQIEQICALFHLGHISLDASKTLINKWLEEEIINQNMSRNVNFKPSDISSIFNDVSPLRYFKRLFNSPIKAKENVKRELPILNLMTHVNTSYSKPLFEALGDRLIYIRVSRHPMTINMIKHNKNWTDRWQLDDRHSYILYNNNKVNLPFFAKSFEEKYLTSNSTDRAILLFDHWIRNGDLFLDNVKKSFNSIIIEIPYENFIFEPNKYVEKISKSLGVKPDNKTKKMMQKQKVPRTFAEQLKNEVNLKNKFDPVKKNLKLSDIFSLGRAYAAKTASQEGLKLLDKLAEDYEVRHNINK